MAAPEFNLADRMLHRLALASPRIGQAAFDLEQRYGAGQPAPPMAQPVFVSGLARSGSTALLNLLHQAGNFRSLTYRDMPFVLATGLWKKLNWGSRREMEKQERAHGDKLLVDFDSPEAFEEVFWRTFCGRDYIRDRVLVAHAVETPQLKRFRQFVRQVLRSGERPGSARYLSKNNNNILRLAAIRRAFRDAAILVPFREPLAQAGSLLNQHRRFCSLQARDRFSRDYLRWLGHHEFGPGHKAFCFDGQPPEYPQESLDYWLATWLHCYRHLLHSPVPGLLFVGHEQAGQDPSTFFHHLSSTLGLAIDGDLARRVYRQAKPALDTGEADGELLQQCRELYEALCQRGEQLASAPGDRQVNSAGTQAIDRHE